ncbi:aldo/keto reductase family protein [Nitzschia inconspicua]|uniref:Aldo/keto reductase family protein n=1 Tax=Nitzschia inconspicua TaxID=303405 RepID=A0A9K3PV79_9STRA|nr:aldo/keto reductase family protein [Nitzschia inconspicua]
MIGKSNNALVFLALFATATLSNVGDVDAFTVTDHRCIGGAVLSGSKHPVRTSWLASSSFDDDELAKLIGKRSQIKRKKKEELPNEDVVFEALTESTPPEMLDLDWDNMPEFQTKRPVRESKKKDEEDDDALSFRSSSNNEPAYVDFMADYEDENEFHIPNRLGVTTRCWGEESLGFVATGKLKKQQLREGKFVPGDLQLAFNNLLDEGILLFETSPEYGKAMATKKLSAEHILGRCIQEYQGSDTMPLLVDTFANKIWQRRANAVTSSLTASCEKLEISSVDILQAKNIGWLPSGGIIKGMSEVVIDQGTANYVGVKNISPLRLRRLMSKLEKQGLTVTTNAFEFSLTQRGNEKWITACKALGVIPLIHNPLGSGLASGQYTATNPSGGLASSGATKFSFAVLEKLQPLHSVLESVAERVKTRLTREVRDVQERYRGRKGPPPKINTDITTTQVALNYIIAKGGVPLAEVNSPKEAQEVIGCLGWSLNDDEVAMLESAAELCVMLWRMEYSTPSLTPEPLW